jgi:hypothetical protein
MYLTSSLACTTDSDDRHRHQCDATLIGPMTEFAPEFPRAAGSLAPLRAKSEAAGSTDFTPLWSGQAVGLCRELPAMKLTSLLAEEAKLHGA